jgi:DNA-binding transcriptional LysR family regulator
MGSRPVNKATGPFFSLRRINDLRLFAAVVEEGSITAGASRAGISLPSASARMKVMEAALGTALLALST